MLLALEVPADRLITAIAEESALADGDLDVIESRIVSPLTSPGETAALSLTLGRAGRASSARPLGAARTRIGGTPEAKAISVALELLSVAPPRWLSRAERGYRRLDPITGEELFIEDPLAAHWHHEDRWGPPLRADASTPCFSAAALGLDVSQIVERVRAGSIALVTFAASKPWVRRIDPALRLARAGLTQDASMRHLVRWTGVRSIGTTARRFAAHAAYEAGGDPPVVLPAKPSIPTEMLVEVMARLSNAARS